MEFCIIEKANNSIATKLYVHLLNNYRQKKLKISERHNSITKCVVQYLNMKMKGKLVEIIDFQLCSSLK